MRSQPPAFAFLGITFWIAAVLATPAGFSQEAIVAMGNVASDGTLGTSASPSGAAITAARLGEGDYEVYIDLVGAFEGLDIEDFVIEAGVESGLSGDIGVTARIDSVNSGALVVGIRTLDLEDSGSVNNPVPSNQSFYFLIRRAPSGAVEATDGDSRYLLAAGKLDTFFGVESFIGIGGISVEFFRESTGHSHLFLEKTGAFVGDNSEDYLIFLTSMTSGTEDEILRGDVKSTVLDSSVSFTVRTDDVQDNPAGNAGIPADGICAFAIYRIGGAESTGLPASRHVLMTASVRGSDGLRRNAATSIPGANVITNRDAEGVYFVSFVSTGAFDGITNDRFVPIVTARGGLLDNIATAQVGIVNDNTLQITVRTKDVQTSGQAEGVLQNNDFYLVLYDTEAAYAPDLGIGVRNSPATFRTFGVRNASGAGQATVVKTNGTKRQRFYVGSRNEGRSIDGMRLRQIGKGKGISTDYFRITGGRANLTATIRTGGLVTGGFRPDELIVFEGGVRYQNSEGRRPKTFRLQATSESSPTSIDVNQFRSLPR